jgi:molybdopterin/thiamine biosynthesis adenylyltransferase/DNA-binding transcriptional regulator YhcF (GntR family)
MEIRILWFSGLTSIPGENKMTIKISAHRSLTEVVAGKIATSVLDGTYKTGSQLPAERELVKEFGISRSTLREALKILAEHKLIEGKHGVGWFVCAINASNLAKSRELAFEDKKSADVKVHITDNKEIPTGPRRLPVTPEKPLQIPNLRTDRLGTFKLISWWEREKVEAAKVLVVGAGALGNEVIKNLVLMGIGNIYILDFDTIELANLSRSVLYRESDSGREKAEVAAARAKEINPGVHVQYLHGDVNTQLGLGVIRRMDVVVGCLDNREARLAVNRFCYWMNKPWVDGAIQEFLGLVRVFVPGKGACFECSLTEAARRDLSVRYSCPLLARENVLLGKVPTTPTIASIIGAMQAQEALKIIHGMPVDAGKVTRYNGMNNDMYTSAYQAREDCESHWIYGDVAELPLKANLTTLEELLRIARQDLGDEAVLELDQELILTLVCPKCKTTEQVLKPISQVSFQGAHCPVCGTLREIQMTHMITGDEPFITRTLESVGVPPLHILRAYNAQEYRFYELTGDLPEALHFNHFEKPLAAAISDAPPKIRLGENVAPEPAEVSETPKKNWVVLLDE